MTPLVTAYLFLLTAIILETIATSMLHASHQFTKLIPSIITALCYATSFYCLSHVLRTMNVGVAYAIWSGLGIVLISIISWVVFKQKLDLPAIIGLGLIISGVVVVNVFSKSVGH